MFDFEMFDNMAGFFGTELAEESKPSKKAGKETKAPATTDADAVDLDTSDDDEMEESEESLGEASKASAAKGKSTKKVSATGENTVIKLPCRIYARNFKVTVDSLDTCTLNGLVARLVELGYNEVKASAVNFIVCEKGSEVYLTSPQSATASDTLVEVGDTPVFVSAGMVQCELTEGEFAGLDKDEISVDHLAEKWASVNGEYTDCGLSYDATTKVAIPVVGTVAKKEFSLPITVCYLGTRTEVYETDFLMFKEKYTNSDLTEHLFPNIKCDVTWKELNGIYYHEFKEKKGQTAVRTVDRKKWSVNAAGGVKKAVTKYSLPFNIYFVNLGITMPLEAAMFNGKERVSEEEVLNFMKPSYSILRNADRKVDCFYSEETNTMSIALVSGKKGAMATTIAEENVLEGPGLFKLLHTLEEYKEALKSDSFLGYYRDGVGKRIESTPVAAFIGTMGQEKECCTVKSVELQLKIPKIPATLYDTICLDFRNHPMEERIIQVYWDSIAKKHVLVFPEEADAKKTYIKYKFGALPKTMKLVLTVHSHNTMAPYFSVTDDRDEAMTGIYGVVGTVNVSPTACFRVGMESAFSPLSYSDLFEEV